jgi:hypothetical protein
MYSRLRISTTEIRRGTTLVANDAVCGVMPGAVSLSAGCSGIAGAFARWGRVCSVSDLSPSGGVCGIKIRNHATKDTMDSYLEELQGGGYPGLHFSVLGDPDVFFLSGWCVRKSIHSVFHSKYELLS